MLFAKLSTDKTIVFGPVLDSTGAAVTSEVVASIKIMKNGASAAALDAAATLTHSATGVYLLLLKAADISAVGECTVVLNSGTNSASAVRLNVLPATVYAAIVENAVNATGGLVGATAAITTMAGEIATATNITVSSIGADVVNASALAADACAKIADVVRRRTQANVELSSYGDALSLGSEYGLIQQAQESNAVDTPGTLTIYKTDGSTVLGTKTLDTDAAAEPVVGVS